MPRTVRHICSNGHAVTLKPGEVAPVVGFLREIGGGKFSDSESIQEFLRINSRKDPEALQRFKANFQACLDATRAAISHATA
jgi:hypothetical protein